IPSGEIKAELRDSDAVLGLKFGPHGLLLATRSDGISIWDPVSSQQKASFSGGTCPEGGPCVWRYFDKAELSSDGSLLATAGRENSGILVQDLEGKVILWMKNAESRIFLFLPDSPNTLMLITESELDYWDVRAGKIVRR